MSYLKGAVKYALSVFYVHVLSFTHPNLSFVSCSEVNFWLDQSRFYDSFPPLTRRLRDGEVIKHAMGVGLRNAGHGISGRR